MAGVYISYPFCAQKCTYCNFASGVSAGDLPGRYVEALESEIRAHVWEWRPETVYLGGGTPSTLDDKALERILSAVPASPWMEATIEAAPGTITPERVSDWRRLGINRVSLGVQSFVRAELARTGRKHTAETVARDVALLRDAGIANLNLDLIAGLPGQTRQSWDETLDWVERIGAPHASVYMLEVDADSRLGAEILRGGERYGAAGVAPDEVIVELYQHAVDRLALQGLERYEISNFALPGFESAHNLKYWMLEPYAGFGADAHSFDGQMRTKNVETAAEYVDRVGGGESPIAETTPADAVEERFFVGLRLASGIRPRPEDWRRFQAPIQRFLSAGWLESNGHNLRLTSQGVLFSNEVFQEFIA
jgi:oxygen-independent coproporphyrinogen-3 oxidase